MEDSEVDFRDFFPASLRDPEAMWAELRAIVAGIGNESHPAACWMPFWTTRISPRATGSRRRRRAFTMLSAAACWNMCCRFAAWRSSRRRTIQTVDLDLLLAGCVLHDIGKIHELTYERGFGYSAEGQLLGHIAIAIRMMADKLRAFPDFPVELRNLLEHMILSHHGQLEFGSPKVPVFPEALLLHYLDDMDSKMECMRALIEKDPQAEGYFTGLQPTLERVALRKTAILSRKPAVRYLRRRCAPPASVPRPTSTPFRMTLD